MYRAALAALRKRLRQLRTQRGWTMEEAADRCGLLYQNYQAIEAGKVNVTLVTLARLADGFRAELVELLVPDEYVDVLRRLEEAAEAERLRRREAFAKGRSRPRRKKTTRRVRTK